jgi:hypothetical protein
MVLMVIALGMSGHLNDRGWSPDLVEKRTSLVEEAVCELEESACNGHSSCKSTKKGTLRPNRITA